MNTISGLIIDMKVKEERRGGERITFMGEIWFEGEEILLTKPSLESGEGLL